MLSTEGLVSWGAWQQQCWSVLILNILIRTVFLLLMETLLMNIQLLVFLEHRSMSSLDSFIFGSIAMFS